MKASRITILHPDDETGDQDVEIENAGRVYYKQDQVKIKETHFPGWFRAGVFIVATDRKGNTIDGYVIDWDFLTGATTPDRRKLRLETQFPP